MQQGALAGIRSRRKGCYQKTGETPLKGLFPSGILVPWMRRGTLHEVLTVGEPLGDLSEPCLCPHSLPGLQNTNTGIQEYLEIWGVPQ